MNRKDSVPMARCLGIFAVLILVLCVGCLPASRPAKTVKEYLINYEPPNLAVRAGQPLLASVRVNRFSTAAPYDDPAVVVRSGPFNLYSSPFERWRVTPGEMLGEFLARDIKESGVFTAVFSEYDLSEARINLDGLVEEFSEQRDKGSRRALLRVRLTLLDTDPDENFKVLFQKAYTQAEPIDKEGAKGFIAAMSRAARRFSLDAIEDIIAALKEIKE